MSAYANVVQGIYTALVSATRTVTQTILGSGLINPGNVGINPECSGLVAYLNVTAASGTGGVSLSLEEQDPASGVWSVLAASTPTTVTGMVRLKIKPAVTAVAASAAGITVQDVLPALWRIRVVHADGSNYTYSLGVVVYN